MEEEIHDCIQGDGEESARDEKERVVSAGGFVTTFTPKSSIGSRTAASSSMVCYDGRRRNLYSPYYTQEFIKTFGG